jgi:3-deoxy-D-manno-octulosonic-acid transferase
MSRELKAGMLYFLYNVVWLFISIPFLLILCWRYRKHSQHRTRFWERLSIYKKLPAKCTVWVHVASVGEVIGCLPILTELQRKYKNSQLLITTTTPTGEAVLRQHLGENVTHIYLPFDFVFFMHRFIKKVKPKLLLIFETEIWPSMVNICHKSNVDTVLINARMSEKSMNNYKRFFSLSHDVFSKLTFVAAQSSSDASRLQSLGAHNIRVTGSIKSDVTISEQIVEASRELRSTWLNSSSRDSNDRKILLAASTHESEEEIILKTYNDLRQSHPKLLLVLVPRHVERFDQVEQLCIKEGFTVARRSLGKIISPQTDIVLGDTMGELLMLFGISDVVVMGGTFIEHGGHNFLEPAIWGIPIVSGKSDYNFSDIARELVSVGGLMQVNTSEELSEQIKILLTDDQQRLQKGRAAKEYVQQKQGSLKALLTMINPYLNR